MVISCFNFLFLLIKAQVLSHFLRAFLVFFRRLREAFYCCLVLLPGTHVLACSIVGFSVWPLGNLHSTPCWQTCFQLLIHRLLHSLGIQWPFWKLLQELRILFQITLQPLWPLPLLPPPLALARRVWLGRVQLWLWCHVSRSSLDGESLVVDWLKLRASLRGQRLYYLPNGDRSSDLTKYELLIVETVHQSPGHLLLEYGLALWKDAVATATSDWLSINSTYSFFTCT